MQVSVEVTSGLQRRITVSVPREQVDEAYQARMKELSRSAKLKGFRPGKIPAKILEKHFSEQARSEAVERAMHATLPTALSQHDVQPVGSPVFSELIPADDGSFSYVVSVEVYPDTSDVSLDNISIERPVVDITDDDVVEMLESLRKQRRTWRDSSRTIAESGDRLRIDYRGTLNGEAFSGGSADDQLVELGSGRYLPDFEAALVGAVKDATTEFDATFPTNFPQDDLAGQVVHFTVTVKAIEEPVLPDLDDAFAEFFGVSEGGMEKMREEVRENLINERDNAIRTLVKQRLFDGLVAHNTIEVPRSLVEAESRRMAEDFVKEMLEHRGLNLRGAIEAERFASSAEGRVKMGLLLRELVDRQQLTPDPERLHTLLERLAASYDDPEGYIAWYYTNPDRLADLESAVLEDQVADWMLQCVTVSDCTMSFKELMDVVKNKKASTPSH